MSDPKAVTPSAPCPHCNGMGPIARADWHRFSTGDRCPNCGAQSQPGQVAPPDAESARVDEVLDILREVLISLPEEEREGALLGLERRAAELNPSNRPAPVREEEPPCCPSCAAPSRPHRYSGRLFVCTALSCGVLWSRNRRGQARIEPVL